MSVPGESDVAIVVPAYNEGVVIGSVLGDLLARYPTVICVDDGSTDDTAHVASATGATLVRHPINLGQGAALQTGIEFALQDSSVSYFVTFDADGQHRVQDIELLLEQLRAGDAEIALGSRFLTAGSGLTRSRRRLLKLAVLFTRLSTGVPLTDAHNGLRAFNRRVAETLELEMADMSHASELVAKIRHNGYRYAEVPVVVNYTEYSMGKGQSPWNAVNILFDLILTPRSRR
jgi:glycosyltransferase involved in cell wall biosynthesis